MSRRDKDNFSIPKGQEQPQYTSVRELCTGRSFYDGQANSARPQNNAGYPAGNPAPNYQPHSNSVPNQAPRTAPRQTPGQAPGSGTVQMPSSGPYQGSMPATTQIPNNRQNNQIPGSSIPDTQDGFAYNNYRDEVPQSIFNQPASQQAQHGTAGMQNDTQPAAHSTDSNVRYKPKQRKSPVKSILTFVLIIALFVGLAWVLRTYVFCAYEIPSGSMEETIMTGDMVFAEKISKIFSQPKRGDIVTFDDPNTPDRVLIKRVIATGGQTVDIKNNKIYVDNVELDEPYTNNRPTKKLSNSISYPYTVPQGYVWVMGDNRTNSSDSRVYGPIPQTAILGHALAVYWPTSDAKLLS